MPVFAMKSLCPEHPLEDASADYRSACRAEQYRVSGRAIYFAAFPGTKYLSFEAVNRAWVKKSSMPLTGCCGNELPMYNLRLWYEGGFYQDFTFEKQAEAEDVLASITAARPELPVGPPEK